MALVYTAAILLSALLLFALEPMIAKMILPRFGGVPAVWNTAVVFYQLALLLGYSYTHVTTRCLGARRQSLLHLVLLLAPFLVLPIAFPSGAMQSLSESPVAAMLELMATRVGLPFAVLSTTSPLLQRWFSSTRHPSAKDPYFLYAASNAGSLVALIAYPLLVEPRLRLADQSLLWAIGYALFVALAALCAWQLWRAPAAVGDLAEESETAEAQGAAKPLSFGRRLRWVLLAAVPSSLMLSVTTHLSTNITPFPLLWVVPLAIYLLTFILVYARRQIIPAALTRRACRGPSAGKPSDRVLSPELARRRDWRNIQLATRAGSL